MSNIGNTQEGAQALAGAKEKVDEATGVVNEVVQFLERMVEELAGLGLPVENKEAAKAAVEELLEPLSSLGEKLEEAGQQVAGLGDNLAG
jgi:hypothetical protein